MPLASVRHARGGVLVSISSDILPNIYQATVAQHFKNG